MTRPTNDSSEPTIARELAPEHRQNFWGDLEASLTNPTSVMETAVVDSRTEQLPQVAQLQTAGASKPAPARRMWPMAAAAAALVIVGLGFISLRGSDPATTAEIVAGPTESSEVVPLDGPTGTNDGDSATGAETSVEADSSNDDAQAGAVDVVPTPEPESAGSVATEPTPTPAPAREFDPAFGATGVAEFLPFDDSLADDATFLANWDRRALTWYSQVDPDLNCVDREAAQINYVNGSGLVQPVRDPQLRFSGDVSHFTVHPEEDLAAWIVACGSQLELYTATLATSGQVEHLNLVWLGEGSPRAALMLWDGSEINLNAIDPNGTPFAIGYDVEADELTRNDGPARNALEEGSPARRAATPIAATTDGGVSYWVGQAPSGIFSACPETYGSDLTDTLWLRYGDGTWQPALVDETPLGRITAVAIEPTFSQIAFADVCEGQTQRLFLGTLRADGRVSNLRDVSLTPYVPGFASELFWIDAQTLRIEVDNSAFGAQPNRLDFRFDDGRQAGIIVQID